MFVSTEEESHRASHEDSAAEVAAMGYKPQANCVRSHASSSSGLDSHYSRRRFFCCRCSSASLCLVTHSVLRRRFHVFFFLFSSILILATLSLFHLIFPVYISNETFVSAFVLDELTLSGTLCTRYREFD